MRETESVGEGDRERGGREEERNANSETGQETERGRGEGVRETGEMGGRDEEGQSSRERESVKPFCCHCLLFSRIPVMIRYPDTILTSFFSAQTLLSSSSSADEVFQRLHEQPSIALLEIDVLGHEWAILGQLLESGILRVSHFLLFCLGERLLSLRI